MISTVTMPVPPELMRIGATPSFSPEAEKRRHFTPTIEQFLNTLPETPCLAMDLSVVRSKYSELRKYFSDAAIYYAVKANPARDVVFALAAMGASFDVASPAELVLGLSLGVPPNRMSYGNTIKKAADISYAFERGVTRFAFDSEVELKKLAVHAPGSEVTCRLQTTCKHAAWPLAKKFGCDRDMAAHLLVMAKFLGLKPIGIGFHVGSQQTDPTQWEHPMQETAAIFRKVARHGIELHTVNAGGGFPVPYESSVPQVEVFAHAIAESMRHAFGGSQPHLMLEPGRSLVAEAGVIESEVVLVARKSLNDATRWVYLDVGKFGGLAETLDESIKYRLHTTRTGIPGPVVLAGPTCDSADILYEKTPYELPLDLDCGDRVSILNAGAYTSTYASVGFNGFPPLKTYCL
jgi:ornithine decarboxylase